MSDDEIAAYLAGKAVFDNIYAKMNLSKLEADNKRELDALKRQHSRSQQGASSSESSALSIKYEEEFRALLDKKDLATKNANVKTVEAKSLARSWQRTATEAITARDAWKSVFRKLFKEDKIKVKKEEVNKMFNANFDENIEANLNAMRRI